MESVVTRSERSVVGCTHSGGGSGLKEDIHLRRVIECEIGYRVEGFGNGNLELLVKGKWWIRFRSEAEKGILRSFFIWVFCSVMIIAGTKVELEAESIHFCFGGETEEFLNE